LEFPAGFIVVASLIYADIRPAGAAMTTVNINGKNVGRTFEGIGAVSAGASSRLLADYPEPFKSDILDYLFKPNFGAGFQHLKVEIGGDLNSTDGSEPSFARTRAEMANPNFNRGYEYWLMQQAHNRNQNILLDGLWWTLPAWITEHSQDEADYLTKFIQGAKSSWGVTMNFIAGNRNEIGWNPTNTTRRDFVVNYLRPTLDRNGLQNVKIEIADEANGWVVADQLVKDPAFLNAINAVCTHYPAGQYPSTNAVNTGKSLWSSEDYSKTGVWNDGFGFAVEINRNYVHGKMTKTEAWCPINSFYDSLLCPKVGVMRANTPWSGYYEVSPAVWCVAHTTQFAQPGWLYVDGGCGTLPGPSGNNYYVTMKKPDSSGDYSTIIANTDYSGPVTFNLSGGLSTGVVHVWTSDSTAQFIHSQDITPMSATFTIKLSPNTIYSLTTTSGQRKGWAVNPIPADTSFPETYSDNFENYGVGTTPKYFSDQHGTFEIARLPGEGKSLRQVIPMAGTKWFYSESPFTLVGDMNWENYAVSVDALIEKSGTVNLIGRLGDQTSWTAAKPNGYVFSAGDNGEWLLAKNVTLTNSQHTTKLASGTSSVTANTWHNLKMTFMGNRITASLDDIQVAAINDATYRSGMPGIGTGWNTARFENFKMKKSPDSNNDIARRKRASADSEYSPSYSAAKANDGDATTRWCAADGNLNHWWKVDLGAPSSITGSEVTWEFPAKVYQYKIEVSSDNVSWTSAVDKLENSKNEQIQSDSFTANARYVRLIFTGLDSGCWASMFSFKVFGAEQNH